MRKSPSCPGVREFLHILSAHSHRSASVCSVCCVRFRLTHTRWHNYRCWCFVGVCLFHAVCRSNTTSIPQLCAGLFFGVFAYLPLILFVWIAQYALNVNRLTFISSMYRGYRLVFSFSLSNVSKPANFYRSHWIFDLYLFCAFSPNYKRC